MKIEVELDEEKAMKLVQEIVDLEDAYKLLWSHLSSGSTILKDLDNVKSGLRMDFPFKVFDHSDREEKGQKLLENLEFRIRSGME